MTVFVLIHGGFMGGWVWKPAVRVLSAAGHEVYAPSLDGCGERASQVRPGITLTSQAEEVADMLFRQDVNDAVLVSTSTGGLVAAKTAELARDRVGHLVFVDALAPQPGEAISDIVIPQANMSYEFTELTRVLSRDFMEVVLFLEQNRALSLDDDHDFFFVGVHMHGRDLSRLVAVHANFRHARGQ